MSRLHAGLVQIWMIVRAGDRAIWVLLALILALGVWPGFMVWAIKHSVNQLANGDRNSSLAYIGIIAGAGTIAILLNVIQPYFLRKVKDHVYHNLSIRLFDNVNRRTENEPPVRRRETGFQALRNRSARSTMVDWMGCRHYSRSL